MVKVRWTTRSGRQERWFNLTLSGSPVLQVLYRSGRWTVVPLGGSEGSYVCVEILFIYGVTVWFRPLTPCQTGSVSPYKMVTVTNLNDLVLLSFFVWRK